MMSFSPLVPAGRSSAIYAHKTVHDSLIVTKRMKHIFAW